MTKARVYQDFVLELRDFNAADESYTVALVPGQKWGEVKPIPMKLDLNQDIQGILNKLETKKIWPEQVVTLGKWLADHILPDGLLRQRFVSAVQAAGLDGGIRLRLVVQDFKLQQLPWEYTYLPLQDEAASNGHFLVLDPRVSLVRYLPLEAPPPTLAPVDPTHLRLLTVSASPKLSVLAPLDLEKDYQIFKQVLSGFDVEGVQIEWLPYVKDATEQAMDSALQQKPHLFHFSGHGVYRERDESGSLVLLADVEKKEPFYLSAANLAKKLQAAGVRLVFLGACETGRLHGETPWTSIAPALNLAGIPAVIAMQYELGELKAGPFTRAFYTALAAGLTLDEATFAGRLATWKKEEENVFEWGVPTLYLHSLDGALFPELEQRQTQRAERLRSAIRIHVDQMASTGIARSLSVDDLVGPLPEMPAGLDININVGTNAGLVEAVHIGKVRPVGTEDSQEEDGRST